MQAYKKLPLLHPYNSEQCLCSARFKTNPILKEARMANLDKFNENPQQQLLEEVKGARCVMLGSTDPEHHMQPMAPQIDPDNRVVYFYSDNKSELGEAIMKNPGMVHMCHIDKDYQACVRGHLAVHTDPAIVDKFWNPIVSAWYPGGKTDPKLIMLRFLPDEAAIWASTGNPLKFMYEVAKANIKDTEADMGEMKVIDL